MPPGFLQTPGTRGIDDMGKRGPTPAGEKKIRRSAVKLSLPVPDGMSADGAALWRDIVTTHPAGNFQAGDVPLLRSYCEEYARRNRAEQHLFDEGEVIETATGAMKRNPWHEVLVNSNNQLSQLATKLRLCVNSRITAKKAGGIEEKFKSRRDGLLFEENYDQSGTSHHLH